MLIRSNGHLVNKFNTLARHVSCILLLHYKLELPGNKFNNTTFVKNEVSLYSRKYTVGVFTKILRNFFKSPQITVSNGLC
jgi:hypothetical protein